MNTLYETSTEVRALNDLYLESIDEETGEIKDAAILEKWEREVKTALEQKSKNIVGFVRNAELLVDNIDNEIKRLQALKKSTQNKLDRTKDYIVFCMRTMGIKKIETPLGTLSLRKSVGVVIDENVLDQTDKRYMTEKTTYTISKTALKELIKNGENIEGATLQEKQNLQIR